MDPVAVNKMLEARVKDLADCRASSSRDEHGSRCHANRPQLERCLGLFPLPPRTDLRAQVRGVLQREGYRIEKLRYESRPGVLVTAHLYLPNLEGRAPLVLHAHGHWQRKKSTPWVQARCIGLALLGFASLLVDSPGTTGEPEDTNERASLGPHDDPWLSMGAPVTGQYVWDLMRGLDYCESRAEIDSSRVGITGASGGGTTSMYAFAMDVRIKAAAPVCAVSSMAVMPHNGCLCNHVPGVMQLGDRADILALRAPDPVMIIGASDDPEFPADGMRVTFEKLRSVYKHYRAEDKVRLEIIEGQHDYNRRMREAVYAFFCEHLKGEPKRGHIAEPRPLTDSAHNPYESGTEPATSPDLLVTGWHERQSLSFRDLLQRSLAEPYPEDFNEGDRLVPWGKYGRLAEVNPGPSLRLVESAPSMADKSTVVLPVQSVDQRLCFYLGLSVPEVLAQVLHLIMPGRPDGWEANAVGAGDAISSMIASVKTLVSAATPVEKPTHLVAEGEAASLTAAYLKLLRPDLVIEPSHTWHSWSDLIDTGNALLAQPGARYLKWPFDT